MGRKIDVDDLMDAGDVAQLLGLASRKVVAVYRGRYEDFPKPVHERSGRPLWVRSDVEEWAARRATAQPESSTC